MPMNVCSTFVAVSAVKISLKKSIFNTTVAKFMTFSSKISACRASLNVALIYVFYELFCNLSNFLFIL